MSGTPLVEGTAPAMTTATATAVTSARTVAEVLAQSQVESVMDELDRDLIGLAPVKQRIRDIAALLVIDKLRMNLGLQAGVGNTGRKKGRTREESGTSEEGSGEETSRQEGCG